MFDLRHTRRTWAGFVCVMGVLVWVMYGSTPELMLDADDAEYLSEAAQTHRDFSRLFSVDRHPVTVGRPVMDLVFWIDYALWKDDAAWYHHQAVLFHFCASLLLALIFHQLGASLAQSFLGALLFSVNVAHFRVVHWIAATGYSLALFFSLVAILCHQKVLETRENRWAFCAAFALGTAVFCHPSALSVLLFLIYLSAVHLRSVRSVLTTTWLCAVVVVSCLGVSFFAYPQASQNASIQSDVEIGYLIQNALWFVGRLASTSHWLWAPPVDEAVAWEFVAGGVGWLLMVVLVIRQKRPVATWAVWIGLTLLPFVNYLAPEVRWFPAGPSRYLYFASAGSSFLLGALILYSGIWLQRHVGQRPAQISIGIIVLGFVAWSLESERRVRALSLYASGRSYVARRQVDAGVVQFQRAVDRDSRLAPADVYQRLAKMQVSLGQSPMPHLQMGQILYPENAVLFFIEAIWDSLQKTDRARVALGRENMRRIVEENAGDLAFRRNAASVYLNLGIAHYNRKAFSQAIPMFERALELHAEHPGAAYYLGMAYRFADHPDDALRAFRRAVEVNSRDAKAYLNIAQIFLQYERFEDARDVAELMLRFEPENADAHYVYGAALGSLGRYREAETAFLRAIESNADHIPARLDLASLYLTDRPQRAAQLYREVLALAPDNATARRGLRALAR